MIIFCLSILFSRIQTFKFSTNSESLYIQQVWSRNLMQEIKIPILYINKQGINRIVVQKLITYLCIRIVTLESVCQAKSSYVTMIHADTTPNLPSHFGTALSHTCTCTSRWIVPRRAITLLFPPSTITPFGQHDHVKLSRRVRHSRCRPLSNSGRTSDF